MVFETFQRGQGQNGPRTSGLQENTRLKSKNDRKVKNGLILHFSRSFGCFLRKELQKFGVL